VSGLGWIGLVVRTEWRVQEKVVRYLTVMSGTSTEWTTKKIDGGTVDRQI